MHRACVLFVGAAGSAGGGQAESSTIAVSTPESAITTAVEGSTTDPAPQPTAEITTEPSTGGPCVDVARFGGSQGEGAAAIGRRRPAVAFVQHHLNFDGKYSFLLPELAGGRRALRNPDVDPHEDD